MPKAKYAPASRRRRKKIRKLAKGYWGARHRWHRLAEEAVDRALAYSTRDRRVRKREFRQLWITRIKNACRNFDISYSNFLSGLKRLNIALNRKTLSELAICDQKAFAKLVETVKEK